MSECSELLEKQLIFFINCKKAAIVEGPLKSFLWAFGHFFMLLSPKESVFLCISQMNEVLEQVVILEDKYNPKAYKQRTRKMKDKSKGKVHRFRWLKLNFPAFELLIFVIHITGKLNLKVMEKNS